MKAMTHEEMFLDVDKNGQFIPGVKPPKEKYQTYRQVFEKDIKKELDEFTNLKYRPGDHAPRGGLLGDILETARDLRTGRNSPMERRIFDKVCNIVYFSACRRSFDFAQESTKAGKPVYIGEFPLAYYENADHIKVDEMGRRYSTEMDVFYMLLCDLTNSNPWEPPDNSYLRDMQDLEEQLEKDKPGFLAGKKKREYYAWQKERTEKEILKLKQKCVQSGYFTNSDLFNIRLIRLWTLNACPTKTKEDRDIRKKLLENLDFYEQRLLNYVKRVTEMELELGIENDSFLPYEPKKTSSIDWDDDDDGFDDD